MRLGIGILLVLLTGPVAAAEIDGQSGLVIAEGWETVRSHCGGCHSHQLVARQRADRRTWQAIIRWMQDTQNLWQFSDATETLILDYLATNYPPQRDRRRAPIPPWLMPPRPDGSVDRLQ